MATSPELKSKRPLSPHLQVYRLPYNARMSIIGRGVGIVLSLTVTVILAWFVAVVWNPSVYDATMGLLERPAIAEAFKYFLLLGAFVTFFYLGNGIRHVIWDLSVGVNVKFGERTGNIVLLVSALLTLGLWACVEGYFPKAENQPIVTETLASAVDVIER